MSLTPSSKRAFNVKHRTQRIIHSHKGDVNFLRAAHQRKTRKHNWHILSHIWGKKRSRPLANWALWEWRMETSGLCRWFLADSISVQSSLVCRHKPPAWPSQLASRYSSPHNHSIVACRILQISYTHSAILSLFGVILHASFQTLPSDSSSLRLWIASSSSKVCPLVETMTGSTTRQDPNGWDAYKNGEPLGSRRWIKHSQRWRRLFRHTHTFITIITIITSHSAFKHAATALTISDVASIPVFTLCVSRVACSPPPLVIRREQICSGHGRNTSSE